ncbi:hypothetical protein TSAR_016379 [Trichomalopsis sarcophagae]|uniref:Uncharacterized protein n=1 Tax=Trichomalopsis sarcophagae TaxID=543379 RepID=A0A232FAR0_9HYME|nr:hypothetical protein TSAR_016379 [Trichomalopsis sarcophagae]
MLSFRFSSIVSFGLLCLTIVMISADEAPEVPKDPVEAAAEDGRTGPRHLLMHTIHLLTPLRYALCKQHGTAKNTHHLGKPPKNCEQIEDHKSFCYTC